MPAKDKNNDFKLLWGAWKLADLIANGPLGSVFLAERTDRGGKRTAVVRILPVGNEEMATRIATHAHELSELCMEPGLVGYEDYLVVQEENQWYVILRMPYLSLAKPHFTENPFSVEEIARLGIEICAGLEQTEKRGIVHGDISEKDLFIDSNGSFRLSDFSLARMLLGPKGVQEYPRHIAPEIINGESGDSRSDLYSLGLVLYRLLNNDREPFYPMYAELITPEKEAEAFERRIRGDQPSLPILGGQDIGSVVLKAISPKPQDRFSSPAEFGAILNTIIKGPAQAEAALPAKPVRPFAVGESLSEKPAEILPEKPAEKPAEKPEPEVVASQSPPKTPATPAPILNKGRQLKDSAPLLGKVNPLAETAPLLPKVQAISGTQAPISRPQPMPQTSSRALDEDEDIPLESPSIAAAEPPKIEMDNLLPIKKSVFSNFSFGRARSKYRGIKKTSSKSKNRSSRKRNRVDLIIALAMIVVVLIIVSLFRGKSKGAISDSVSTPNPIATQAPIVTPSLLPSVTDMAVDVVDHRNATLVLTWSPSTDDDAAVYYKYPGGAEQVLPVKHGENAELTDLLPATKYVVRVESSEDAQTDIVASFTTEEPPLCDLPGYKTVQVRFFEGPPYDEPWDKASIAALDKKFAETFPTGEHRLFVVVDNMWDKTEEKKTAQQMILVRAPDGSIAYVQEPQDMSWKPETVTDQSCDVLCNDGYAWLSGTYKFERYYNGMLAGKGTFQID